MNKNNLIYWSILNGPSNECSNIPRCLRNKCESPVGGAFDTIIPVNETL